MLLAEERDLRQVPAPALHMDAVRLMTVHGSKGLEFEAVHVPGLATRSFPTSYTGQRCPPPVGLIAGAEGSVSDEAKRSHAMEEECLFFVAMSRARTYLRFYQPRFYPNGDKRSSSKLLTKPPSRLVARDGVSADDSVAARCSAAATDQNHLRAGLDPLRSAA